MTLVDIHCHMLPGVDDGSKDWPTSIKLAKEAVADGVTHAVVTPHTLNGKYLNHKKDIISLTRQYQEMLDEANIPLTVFAGQEVRLSGDLIDAIEKDDILFAMRKVLICCWNFQVKMCLLMLKIPFLSCRVMVSHR